MNKVDFRLSDYLLPRGKYPHSQLAPDLEASLAAGNTVYLWSVPGFFILSGHQNDQGFPNYRHWSDGEKWYKTAKDCLNKVKGKSML